MCSFLKYLSVQSLLPVGINYYTYIQLIVPLTSYRSSQMIPADQKTDRALDQGLATTIPREEETAHEVPSLALVPASCNSLTAQLHSFISKLIQSASLSVQLTAVLHSSTQQASLSRSKLLFE